MKQSRWQSPVLWAAVVAQVITILQITGAFRAMGIDAGVVGDVAAAIMQILVLFGVLNDPTNKAGF
jgi:uncharacterized membrane protein